MEFDCTNRLQRNVSQTYYNQRGGVIQTAGMTDTSYVVPDSLGEAAFSAACGPLDDWFDTAVLLRSDDNEIAFADYLFATGQAR